MPPEKESRDPSEWFRKAKQDLDRVPRRLKENDCEDASFHLQQALEKYLKGFLISRAQSLLRTHNLSLLLDEAAPLAPELEQFRSLCQEVSAFYVEERYPISTQPPTQNELESLFKRAEQLARMLVERK